MKRIRQSLIPICGFPVCRLRSFAEKTCTPAPRRYSPLATTLPLICCAALRLHPALSRCSLSPCHKRPPVDISGFVPVNYRPENPNKRHIEESRKSAMLRKLLTEGAVRQPFWRMIANRRSTTNISNAVDSMLLRSLKEHYLEISKMNPPPVRLSSLLFHFNTYFILNGGPYGLIMYVFKWNLICGIFSVH